MGLEKFKNSRLRILYFKMWQSHKLIFAKMFVRRYCFLALNMCLLLKKWTPPSWRHNFSQTLGNWILVRNCSGVSEKISYTQLNPFMCPERVRRYILTWRFWTLNIASRLLNQFFSKIHCWNCEPQITICRVCFELFVPFSSQRYF